MGRSQGECAQARVPVMLCWVLVVTAIVFSLALALLVSRQIRCQVLTNICVSADKLRKVCRRPGWKEVCCFIFYGFLAALLYLMLASAAAALMFATKETAAISAIVLLLALLGAFVWARSLRIRKDPKPTVPGHCCQATT